MGIRRFCDHCGNTVVEVNKLQVRIIGPYDDDDDEEIPSRKSKTKSQPKQKPQPFTVDLCDHCLPIWVTRVKALTTASDPK